MKYKFHEEPEPLEISQWPDNCFDNTLQYTKELCWICKHTGKDFNKFRVDDETFGEPVMFYSGKYHGYLDSLFYEAFDLDDWKLYWDFDN